MALSSFDHKGTSDKMAKRCYDKFLNDNEIIGFMEDSDDSNEDITWIPSPKKFKKKIKDIIQPTRNKQSHEMKTYTNTSKKGLKKAGCQKEPNLNAQAPSNLLPVTLLLSDTQEVLPSTSTSSPVVDKQAQIASLPAEPIPTGTSLFLQTTASPATELLQPKILPVDQVLFASPMELLQPETLPFKQVPTVYLPNVLMPLENLPFTQTPTATPLPELPPEILPDEHTLSVSLPIESIQPDTFPVKQVQFPSSSNALIPPENTPVLQTLSASPPIVLIPSETSPVEPVPSASSLVIPDSRSNLQSQSSEETSETENSTRSRKRQKDISTWKKNIRKRRRNEGKEYVSTKGKTIPAKALEIVDHVCRYQCKDFTENERKLIHSEFWNLGDWQAQTNFIRYCVQIETPKRSIKKKKISTVITLNTKRVCKDFFLKTLTISNRRFTHAAFTKTSVQGMPVYDKRGKHKPANKTKDDKLKEVREHINSFPKFKSHYSREDAPLKRYLSPELSVAKMYSLYKEENVNAGKQPVREQIYRKVFNTEFNLGFYKLRSDTCNTCDRLENLYKTEESAEKKQDIKEEKENHLLEVEQTREMKHKDKDNEAVHLITFDLEKTLPTPYLQTNLVYYKRQFWTYNLGIHDCKTREAHMYMWGENIASRGASEVASCLLKYITDIVPKDCKHLVAYSDSCGGQNRNQIICRLWMYVIAHTPITTVDHKFMVSGHSYLENDADFSHIEKQKKKAQYIYVPEDWMSLVEKTRKKFKVHRMQQQDFISTDPISKVIINRKIDSAKNKVHWLKIRWMRFLKEQPKSMYFKESLNEDSPFRHVNMDAKKGNIPKVLPRLRETEIKIKHAKIKDLMDLQKFIPSVHHEFYNSLLSDKDQNSQPSSTTGRSRGRPRKYSVQETDEESILDYTLDE